MNVKIHMKGVDKWLSREPMKGTEMREERTELATYHFK